MSSVVVYTAIAGGYDNLLEHPDVPNVDFVCFTDAEPEDAKGWHTEIIPPSDETPRLRAKRYKILSPQRELLEYDYTLWVDGNSQILTPRFVEEAIGCIGEDDIALHAHPQRDCIYEEAHASILTVPEKYAHLPILEQVEHYREQGHPEHWGLWACGSIARRRSTRLDVAMLDWMSENITWTIQDQLSFPYVMRNHGIRPASFPHNQYQSPWIQIMGHNRPD